LSDERKNELETNYMLPEIITYPEGISSQDNFMVTKSNKLISAQTLLTSREQKLLAACISLINPRDYYPNGITVELQDEHIEILTGIKKRHIYRFIEGAAEAFNSIPIEIPARKEGNVNIINIAHRSCYDPETRKFSIQFHDDMKEELVQLSHYTSVELKNLVRLSSKYSIRLYEILSRQYFQNKKGKQALKVTLESLYFPLGLKDYKGKALAPSYIKDFTAFRLRALDPACKDISDNTNLLISYNTYRVGRYVHGVIFSIRVKGMSLESVDNFDLPIIYTLLDIEETASYLKINKSVIDKWLISYSEDDVKANLYLCAKKVIEGQEIKNIVAYSAYLLKNNIAKLPEIANPYSDRYKYNNDSFEFVKRVVVPIWWKLPENLRSELELVSSFSIHPTTSGYYKGFVDTAHSSSYDDAQVLFDSDGAFVEWL